MPHPRSISAVVPCFNEEHHIDDTYRAIRSELARYEDVELIFVNDGSGDRTLERIKDIASRDPAVKYISFSRNFGLEAAMAAGFRYACKEWIVQFDADLQGPAHEAHRLLEKALEGYDAVFAVRRHRRDPLYRRLGSSAQHWVARTLLRIELPRGASTFRVVRASVAKKIVAARLATPYFIATVPRIGATWAFVPTEHRPRTGDRPKWRLSRLVGHSMELFFGFSFVPVLWVWAAALAAAIVAAGAGAVLLSVGAGGATPVLAWIDVALTVAVLAGLAVVARYVQQAVVSAQRGLRLYYVRESNVRITPEDALYEFERADG
jgi:polyisoprenyl-phosphate glycosyltransferase